MEDFISRDLIFKNEFIYIVFDKLTSILEYNWLPATKQFSEEDYKRIVEIQAKAVEDNRPRKIFVDGRNFGFILVPEIQNWANETALSKMADWGVRKFAFSKNADYVIQLAIEQLMKESVSYRSFETSFFDTREEAFEWLRAQ
jgi:hypothetical protein